MVTIRNTIQCKDLRYRGMGVHLRGLLLSLMRGHILISCREKVVSGIMFRSPQSVGCTVHPALVLGGAHTVLLLGVLGRKVLGRSCSAPAETLSVNSRLSVRSTVCLSSLFCLVGCTLLAHHHLLG